MSLPGQSRSVCRLSSCASRATILWLMPMLEPMITCWAPRTEATQLFCLDIFHGMGRLLGSARWHGSALATPPASSCRARVGDCSLRVQLCVITRSPSARPKPGLQARISPCVLAMMWAGDGLALGGKVKSRELTLRVSRAVPCSRLQPQPNSPVHPATRFSRSSQAPGWSHIGTDVPMCPAWLKGARLEPGCRLRVVHITKTAHSAHPRLSLMRVWDAA